MEEKTKQLQNALASTAGGLMILPRFGKLLLGLFRDARVPRWLKILTAGSITYVVLPIDVIPDFVPTTGWVDDMAVIFLILIQYMKYCPPEVFKENWDKTMGDDFSLENDLLKTVARLEPLVGERFASIHNTIEGLIAKITVATAQKAQADPQLTETQE